MRKVVGEAYDHKRLCNWRKGLHIAEALWLVCGIFKRDTSHRNNHRLGRRPTHSPTGVAKGTVEDADVVILVVDDEPGIAAEEGGTGGVKLDEVEVEEKEVEERAELGVENGEPGITENGKDGRGVIEGGGLRISGVDVGKERLGKADVLFDDTWDEPLRMGIEFQSIWHRTCSL